MAPLDRPLTLADFRASGWEEVLSTASGTSCVDLGNAFLVKAKEAKAAGNVASEAVFNVLFIAVYTHLHANDQDRPFGTQFMLGQSRGPDQRDLSDDDLAALGEFAFFVGHNDLKARLSDIVWVARGNNHLLARQAVDSYLLAAKAMEGDKIWPPYFGRIERALRLARTIKYRVDDVIARIEERVRQLNGSDTSFLTLRLMGLLLEFRKGDPVEYAKIAETAAVNAQNIGPDGLDRAGQLRRIQADWHTRGKDLDARDAALIFAAETDVLAADEAENKPKELMPALHSSWRLERAVRALQTIGSPTAKRRADELYPRLREQQRRSLDNLIKVPMSADVTASAELAVKMVIGRPLSEALQIIGEFCRPQSVVELRADVERGLSKFPLVALTPIARYGLDARLEGKVPAFDSSQEGKNTAIEDEMFKQAAWRHRLVAAGKIYPALRQLLSERTARIEDFVDLVSQSPLVSRSRNLSFAKGLFAGYTGDFLTATHLLVPQVEHIVRTLLDARGVITSGFTKKDRQNVFDLTYLLHRKELEVIFDADLVFDFRGLLVETAGSNLRNGMAHGLLDDGMYFTEVPAYFWGACLRLCHLVGNEVEVNLAATDS